MGELFPLPAKKIEAKIFSNKINVDIKTNALHTGQLLQFSFWREQNLKFRSLKSVKTQSRTPKNTPCRGGFVLFHAGTKYLGSKKALLQFFHCMQNSHANTNSVRGERRVAFVKQLAYLFFISQSRKK